MSSHAEPMSRICPGCQTLDRSNHAKDCPVAPMRGAPTWTSLPAPDFPLSDSTFNKLTTTKVMGKSLLGWIQTLHDMEQMYMPPRADAPPPTEAELRERLQAALPGWEVSENVDARHAWIYDEYKDLIALPRWAALRKPGGIEACARALRVLAGVDDQ